MLALQGENILDCKRNNGALYPMSTGEKTICTESIQNFLNWAKIEDKGFIELNFFTSTYTLARRYWITSPNAVLESVKAMHENHFVTVGVNPRPAEGKSKDQDIQIYRNLYIDIEPIHEKGLNSSESELENLREFMIQLGIGLERYVPQLIHNMPMPFTGNGNHLLIAVPDQTNPQEFYSQLKLWYEWLLKKTEIIREKYCVRIDSTFSPARQVKLYGTRKPYPGARLSYFTPMERKEIPEFVEWVKSFGKTIVSNYQKSTEQSSDIIPSGKRNVTLTSLAGTMRRRGFDADAILAALKIENLKRCRPPLDDIELQNIANSIGRYEPQTPNKINQLAEYPPNNGEITGTNLAPFALYKWSEVKDKEFEQIELMSTGVPFLDKYFEGGIGLKEISLFIARQETGKTTLGCLIGANIVKQGVNVLHVFYEDPLERIRNRYNQHLLSAENNLTEVYFLDATTFPIRVPEIETYMESTKPGLVIIDYFARVPSMRGLNESRFEIRDTLMRFANLARNYNCHVMIFDHVPITDDMKIKEPGCYWTNDIELSEAKMYKLMICDLVVGMKKDRHNKNIVWFTGMKNKRMAKNKYLQAVNVDWGKGVFVG